jgi:hypothetical protein
MIKTSITHPRRCCRDRWTRRSTPFPGYLQATRTDIGRPIFDMRFKTWTATRTCPASFFFHHLYRLRPSVRHTSEMCSDSQGFGSLAFEFPAIWAREKVQTQPSFSAAASVTRVRPSQHALPRR